jgi:hypothetical protein
MQRLRGTLAENQKLLNLLTDMDRKARDIATLEQEQEKIIVLLERQHAVMRCSAGQWTIEDMGSTNGTYLNESPLVAQTPRYSKTR